MFTRQNLAPLSSCLWSWQAFRAQNGCQGPAWIPMHQPRLQDGEGRSPEERVYWACLEIPFSTCAEAHGADTHVCRLYYGGEKLHNVGLQLTETTQQLLLTDREVVCDFFAPIINSWPRQSMTANHGYVLLRESEQRRCRAMSCDWENVSLSKSCPHAGCRATLEKWHGAGVGEGLGHMHEYAWSSHPVELSRLCK